MDKDDFEELLVLFPKSAEALQKYAIAQVEHLNKIRQLKQHLHSGNYVKPPSMKM